MTEKTKCRIQAAELTFLRVVAVSYTPHSDGSDTPATQQGWFRSEGTGRNPLENCNQSVVDRGRPHQPEGAGCLPGPATLK